MDVKVPNIISLEANYIILYCLSPSGYQVNCFSTSLIGYLVTKLARDTKCKVTNDDEISDKLSTHPFTIRVPMVYEYEATSEAECAHECRKKHNGECPFFITEYSWAGQGGTPGKCTRTLPTGHRNCNKRDHWEKSSPDVFQLLFNTQNLGICVFLCSHEQIYIYKS